MKPAITMKRFIAVLGIIVLVAAFARGYVAVSGPHREQMNNKVDVNISVDPDKIREDAKVVNDKVRDDILLGR